MHERESRCCAASQTSEANIGEVVRSHAAYQVLWLALDEVPEASLSPGDRAAEAAHHSSRGFNGDQALMNLRALGDVSALLLVEKSLTQSQGFLMLYGSVRWHGSLAPCGDLSASRLLRRTCISSKGRPETITGVWVAKIKFRQLVTLYVSGREGSAARACMRSDTAGLNRQCAPGIRIRRKGQQFADLPLPCPNLEPRTPARFSHVFVS